MCFKINLASLVPSQPSKLLIRRVLVFLMAEVPLMGPEISNWVLMIFADHHAGVERVET